MSSKIYNNSFQLPPLLFTPISLYVLMSFSRISITYRVAVPSVYNMSSLWPNLLSTNFALYDPKEWGCNFSLIRVYKRKQSVCSSLLVFALLSKILLHTYTLFVIVHTKAGKYDLRIRTTRGAHWSMPNRASRVAQKDSLPLSLSLLEFANQ